MNNELKSKRDKEMPFQFKCLRCNKECVVVFSQHHNSWPHCQDCTKFLLSDEIRSVKKKHFNSL